MDDLRKSQTTARQSIRNPSGRVTIAVFIGVITVLRAVFFLTESGDIKENFDN